MRGVSRSVRVEGRKELTCCTILGVERVVEILCAGSEGLRRRKTAKVRGRCGRKGYLQRNTEDLHLNLLIYVKRMLSAGSQHVDG